MIKRLMQLAIGWDQKTEQEKYRFNYGLSSLLGRAICLVPVPLSRLFTIFGSDKQTPGWHAYGDIYGPLFRKWKYSRIKFLEIGIGGYRGSLGGRSLLAWQAFFPFATIVAGDIVPKHELAGGRRQIVQIDQSSAAELDRLSLQHGPFDVIVDDGSHFNAHQILTFQRLWGSLKMGGIYVVEDVQTSFWAGVVAGVEWDGADINDPAFRQTCYGYFLELAKYVNHTEFRTSAITDSVLRQFGSEVKQISFAHNLIILHKGDNQKKSAFA